MAILRLEEVQEAIKALCGGPITLLPLTPGEDSQVWLLIEGDRERVLRVNRSDFGFRKDAFARRHFHSAAVPVPAVLAMGRLGATHWFCITERAPGTTLQELSGEQLHATLRATADTLAALGRCDVSMTQGFGRLDPEGIGSEPDWRSFLRSAGRWNWTGAAHLAGNGAVRAALDKLLALADEVPELRRLVHGDFGSNNVLCDGSSITGVIDWSEAMIGDPLYDVANIFFWRPWLECMEQLAGFLEATRDLDGYARERLLCYQLHIGLREAYESAIQGKSWAASWATARLEDVLLQSR